MRAQDVRSSPFLRTLLAAATACLVMTVSPVAAAGESVAGRPSVVVPDESQTGESEAPPAAESSAQTTGADTGADSGADDPASGDEAGAGAGATAPESPTADAAAKPPALSPQEIADLRAILAASTPQERLEIIAFYKDMGVDLEKALGAAALAGGPAAAGAQPKQTLLQAVQALNFARSPQAVLSARAQMGFRPLPRPDSADAAALAKWLHLQVMAGEWTAVQMFFNEGAPADAAAIYAHILQSMNRPPQGQPGMPAEMMMQPMPGMPGRQAPAKPDPAILPEEVLELADAAPGEPIDWQVDVLAQLFKSADARYSNGPALERIRAGTRVFGDADEKMRDRTARFLLAAGLVLEASKYFPSLDDARTRRDAKVLINHGRFHEGLAASGRTGVDPESERRAAWALYSEAALMEGAEDAARQDAMRRAVDLLTVVPPAAARAWIEQVFATESLAPAALEVIALKAGTLRNAQLDIAQRAQIILTMKEAVDTLLARQNVDIAQVRVPLRMLTSALATEAEAAATERRRRGQPMVSREIELLLRALPNDRWLAALEPSIASRAYKAAIAVAATADDNDVALDYLAAAVDRFPSEAAEFGEAFLQAWQRRLVPPPPEPDDYEFFWWRGPDMMVTAPLTRGKQRRNLEQLGRLMALMQSIGVDAPRLPSIAGVFKACHGTTEVFNEEGIVSVFGPIEQMPHEAAASLADQMRLGLGGDWRNRQLQQQAGMKRSLAEIAVLVEKGYELALRLMDRAIAARPDSWRYAVTKAALAWDRLQFKQAEQKADFATYNQYRQEAFAAFAQTAERYADLVRKGDQRDDPGVYLAWFNAAVGSSELNYLTREDLLVEGSPQDDQIDLVRKSIESLPPDSAERHIGAFARAIADGVPGMSPEVKPRVIRHAMRVIGDHPGGASLRRLSDLYQDLVKDEIKLRLAVDGSDRVGTGKRFGVLLTLRFTTAVDRDTGGMVKYLQNQVFTRVGNQWREMNYRDLLRKSIEGALAQHFEIDGIGFFDAMTPPRRVTEGGDDGWLEKPMAYMLLKARDPSVDRLPPVTMDMQFQDTVGPVTLVLQSNSPPIDAAAAPDSRPVRKLDVTQVVDLRAVDAPGRDRNVVLEIKATGEGVIPELDQLLAGVRDALPGYEVQEKSIEAHPVTVTDAQDDWRRMYMFGGGRPGEEKEYAKADESGFFRLGTERSWVVTYTPAGGNVGSEFRLPTLQAGLQGQLGTKHFADMDIVEVKTASLPVASPLVSWQRLVFVGMLLLVLVAGFAVLLAWLRKRAPALESGPHLPTRITPLSVIATLQRLDRDNGTALDPDRRSALRREIAALEASYFGQAGAKDANGELKAVLERWVVG